MMLVGGVCCFGARGWCKYANKRRRHVLNVNQGSLELLGGGESPSGDTPSDDINQSFPLDGVEKEAKKVRLR